MCIHISGRRRSVGMSSAHTVTRQHVASGPRQSEPRNHRQPSRRFDCASPELTNASVSHNKKKNQNDCHTSSPTCRFKPTPSALGTPHTHTHTHTRAQQQRTTYAHLRRVPRRYICARLRRRGGRQHVRRESGNRRGRRRYSLRHLCRSA